MYDMWFLLLRFWQRGPLNHASHVWPPRSSTHPTKSSDQDVRPCDPLDAHDVLRQLKYHSGLQGSCPDIIEGNYLGQICHWVLIGRGVGEREVPQSVVLANDDGTRWTAHPYGMGVWRRGKRKRHRGYEHEPHTNNE
jgi:hypothetical protein